MEGVGGFLVPLNARDTAADLARRLGLPVVLVVGMRLGCLNHALLTRAQIDACGLRCAGWVANASFPACRSSTRTSARWRTGSAARSSGSCRFSVPRDPKGSAHCAGKSDRGDGMSANAKLADRSLRAVWHPCTQMKHHEALPPSDQARARRLADRLEGRRILDAISSWWVNLLGHGHPRVNAAIHAQLDARARDARRPPPTSPP